MASSSRNDWKGWAWVLGWGAGTCLSGGGEGGRGSRGGGEGVQGGGVPRAVTEGSPPPPSERT